MRTAPWVREITTRHGPRGLAAPEFDYERSRDDVAAHARELGLDFPHLVDPGFVYWRQLRNHYWPTVYLIDRCGRIRDQQIGEVHSDQAKGRRLESRIEELLSEGGACPE